MLGVRRRDLVALTELEPGDDDLHALCGRIGQSDEVRGRTDLRCEQFANPLPALDHRVEVLPATASMLAFPRAQLSHRGERRPRERAECAGVQVGVPVEHRKPGSLLGPRHVISSSTGA